MPLLTLFASLPYQLSNIKMVKDSKTHKTEEIEIPYFSISVAWSQFI